jgi:hypothetical protein
MVLLENPMTTKVPMTPAELRAHLAQLDAKGEVYHLTVGGVPGSPLELYLVEENDREVTIDLHDDGTWKARALPSLSNLARLEGWGLFNVDGRLQLQRVDEIGCFEDDPHALMFVARRASEGSQVHLEALRKIGSLV